MNTDSARYPHQSKAKLQLALSLIVFLAAATAPYIWLIEHFGYDDILREPPATVLQQFHAGGSALVLAWFAFAMSALLFVPVVRAFNRLFDAHWVHDGGAAVLGVGSAVAQAIGLLRWVLVVPGLAASYADPAATPAAREAVIVVFEAVHRYGGMVLGEMIGQLLLAAWTALVSVQLYRSAAVPRWLALGGLLTIPLWVAGQTELLHGVLPSVPAIDVIPIAFVGWEAWLATLAIALLIGAWRDRAWVSERRTAMQP